MSVEQAARVTSSVDHKSFNIQIVYTLGGVALGALIVFTGGASLAVFAAAATVAGTSQSIGNLIDKYVDPRDASEKIVKGVEHVFLEEAKNRAANVSPQTRTDQHDESPATGSNCVFIENAPASRRTDFTKCNGLIIDGAPHIFYGGEPTDQSKRPEEKAPLALQVVQKTVDAAGLVAGTPTNKVEALLYAVDVADYVGAIPEGHFQDWHFVKDLPGLMP
ncbi:hypothetical protein [Polyangium sp. y55x31]|uniref:hypothetical protein n=1 Tax=Polyangium sp. y55x31 TaxID=3042688 RepID=UPI0024827531|nr:hypothetical protein [Polyangium sp. y55x31]MDI1475987.1 hypothetical protein [Polyangium sp. y55x31]